MRLFVYAGIQVVPIAQPFFFVGKTLNQTQSYLT